MRANVMRFLLFAVTFDGAIVVQCAHAHTGQFADFFHGSHSSFLLTVSIIDYDAREASIDEKGLLNFLNSIMLSFGRDPKWKNCCIR